jgi:hypothetical protein
MLFIQFYLTIRYIFIFYNKIFVEVLFYLVIKSTLQTFKLARDIKSTTIVYESTISEIYPRKERPLLLRYPSGAKGSSFVKGDDSTRSGILTAIGKWVPAAA